MKKTTIIALVFLSLAASFAVARNPDANDDRRFAVAKDKNYDERRCRDDRRCVSAPEIDPAQALGALTLLGGAIAVVRGYRRRKK